MGGHARISIYLCLVTAGHHRYACVTAGYLSDFFARCATHVPWVALRPLRSGCSTQTSGVVGQPTNRSWIDRRLILPSDRLERRFE